MEQTEEARCLLGVVRIAATTIKTIILEFVAENGAGHIKEIHLAVAAFRPEVPEHTVRARLSELSRSGDLEEKLRAFGRGVYGLYEENKDLCSVVSYPDRGPWGDAHYRGNCSGHLVKDLVLRFKAESVFDPSEGSGTVRDVVAGLNQHRHSNIEYTGRDLKDGWDILASPLPEQKFGLVWYHPPYHDIIQYSADPRDLSACGSLEAFEVKLNRACERLMESVRPGGVLAVLIGDKRKNGDYYCLMRTLLMNPSLGRLKGIIIKAQYNCTSDRRQYSAGNPFLIPIRHEFCLVFQRPAETWARPESVGCAPPRA